MHNPSGKLAARDAVSSRGLEFDYAALSAVAALGTLFLLACSMAPFPLKDDQPYFLPPSFVVGSGEPLRNPWMEAGFNGKLNWHGFLQPWLVGKLASAFGAGWRGTYLALSTVWAAIFLCVVLLLEGCVFPRGALWPCPS
jgi:hypothetical protein